MYNKRKATPPAPVEPTPRYTPSKRSAPPSEPQPAPAPAQKTFVSLKDCFAKAHPELFQNDDDDDHEDFDWNTDDEDDDSAVDTAAVLGENEYRPLGAKNIDVEPTPKEVPMDTNTYSRAKAGNVASEAASTVFNAVKDGAEMGAYDAFYQILLEIFNILAGESPMLKMLLATDTMVSQLVTTIILPYLLIIGCDFVPGFFPANTAPRVKFACQKVIEYRTAQVVAPLIGKIGAPLKRLGEAAGGLFGAPQ